MSTTSKNVLIFALFLALSLIFLPVSETFAAGGYKDYDAYFYNYVWIGGGDGITIYPTISSITVDKTKLTCSAVRVELWRNGVAVNTYTFPQSNTTGGIDLYAIAGQPYKVKLVNLGSCQQHVYGVVVW